ncbi:unnamed protein product, partial [Mesorhabditis belari]|uniref:J domain-containing protein n=1 Tax=Mesorhabditis belari TaxID=2138241 RepID=A0AAF3EXZ1_9BILA
MSISSGDSLAGDADQDLLLDEEEELDFYAILNVPRDALAEEITKSYRRRCLIFHPDRHTEEDDKRAAEKVFVQLRRAHETLMDPKKRAIYDELGVKGLDAQGWELVSRSSNPENIKKEYEFLQRLRDNEIMLTRTHPTSSIAGMLHEKEDDRFPPQLLGMSISQSVDCPLTNNDRVGLIGRVKAENGRGGGSAAATWKRNLGKFNLENTVSLSADAITGQCRISRPIFQRAAIIIQPALQYMYMQGVTMPTLQIIYSMRLRLRWQGSIILALTPIQSAITTTIVHTENNLPKAIVNLTLAPANPNMRVVYIKRDALRDSFTEFACSFGMFGFSPSVNLERKLSRYSRIGLGLNFAFPSCLLIAKFKVKTGHSIFEWHVAICDDKEEIARSTLYGVILPVVTFQLCKVIFRPIWERIVSVFDDHTQDREIDIAKQEESQRIISLMRNTAERIKREEESKNGVIIVEGRYGACSPESSNAYPVAGDRSIDVTVPLQAMVNDSQLRIHSLNKSQMPGFYDPCPCDPKVLHIRYRFRGEMHAVTVPDDMPVILPVRAHKVTMSTT